MPPRKPVTTRLQEVVDRVELYRAMQAEGAAAKTWRASMGLSRRELSEITGYSERTIAAYEAGQFDADKVVTPKALRTYRLTCAAVALGIDFDWKTATLKIGPAVLTVPSLPRDGSSVAAAAEGD